MPGPGPTPVLAWAVPHLQAVAGVMVTASHNPPRDNGYKVYLEDGSQIVSPVDVEIATAIDAVDLSAIELAEADDPLVVLLDDAPVEAYLDAVPAVRLVPDLDGVTVAYTPMHGVGGDTLLAAFERAGWARPTVVAAQFTPDPDFPTVSFPNPEEPGAMDLLLACAREAGAELALANDPDADRLGAAIPTPDGDWRRLTGDELGWLLADHVLRHTAGEDRLVVTTLVSSSLLARMAAAAGVHHAETFTGFKWIAKTMRDRPGQRFVFGYEQALGYLVTALPRDKDGITAAVLMAEIAALAKAEGVTLQQRLDDLADRFGRYVTAERSLRMEPAVAAARVTMLRSAPPAALAGRPVDEVLEYPEANLLRLVCGRSRVQVRPSGTEPKVKIYGEGVDEDPAAAHRRRGRPPADLTFRVGIRPPAASSEPIAPSATHRAQISRGQAGNGPARDPREGVGTTPGALRREAGWARPGPIRTVGRAPRTPEDRWRNRRVGTSRLCLLPPSLAGGRPVGRRARGPVRPERRARRSFLRQRSPGGHRFAAGLRPAR